MIETDIIFSINVHEDIGFLISQILNIEEHVYVNYIILLNANEFMYNKIQNSKLMKTIKNLKINPLYFEKKRFHGSLTQGIFSNMEFAMNEYNFKYFVILSSRNLFYNKLNKKSFKIFPKTNTGLKINNINTNEWHWSSFINTDLSTYIINNDLLFSKDAHEGLTFDYLSCERILSFLNDNDCIKKKLFNWNHCVEEFALQTICINLTGYYYNLGIWEEDNINIEKLPKNKYVYKTLRYKTIENQNKIIKKKYKTIKKGGLLFLILFYILPFFINCINHIIDSNQY